MTEIEKIEATIASLTRKREACIKHGRELADERAAVALEAHTGNKAARKRLDEINTELATQASKVASFDAALKAAAEKLATAQQVEDAKADKANALALRKVVTEIDETLAFADKHFALAVKALVAVDAALPEVHKLGSAFPSAMQLKVNAEMALKTMIMQLPRHWSRDWAEHLAPGHRRTFHEFWSRMMVSIENNVRQRLGEPLLKVADVDGRKAASVMQRSTVADRKEAAQAASEFMGRGGT